MGRYGSVEISLLYDAPMRKMTVHVLQARGIPCRDKLPTHTQVRIVNIYFPYAAAATATAVCVFFLHFL